VSESWGREITPNEPEWVGESIDAELARRDKRIAELEAQIAESREALKRIRGWRKIGSTDSLGEKLRAIEMICDDALAGGDK